MNNRTFFLIVMMTVLLTGCVTGAGVASSGAQAVYDRHSLQRKLNDRYICMQAYHKIFNGSDQYKNDNISVATFHGEVLLTGEVSDKEKRDKLTEIVKTIPDVQTVYNKTTLSTPSSPLTRVSDSWITTKLETQFLADNEVDPDLIKVVTENGVVYLMGIVPPEQAEEAAALAKDTAGVQDVVKLFSYIRISKS